MQFQHQLFLFTKTKPIIESKLFATVPIHNMNNLIFDVGAHKGEDSDFYLKLGYRVVAIEANPALADYLRKRFEGAINEGRYIVVEKAIGESDEGMAFYVNKMISVWGTADRTWAVRNERIGAYSEEITVQGIRFSDVLKKYGCPHYLKIDVEGADMLCIKALHDLPCRPKYIRLVPDLTYCF